jgi:hypothetical protein
LLMLARSFSLAVMFEQIYLKIVLSKQIHGDVKYYSFLVVSHAMPVGSVQRRFSDPIPTSVCVYLSPSLVPNVFIISLLHFDFFSFFSARPSSHHHPANTCLMLMSRVCSHNKKASNAWVLRDTQRLCRWKLWELLSSSIHAGLKCCLHIYIKSSYFKEQSPRMSSKAFANQLRCKCLFTCRALRRLHPSRRISETLQRL